jgi:hypothetical protein
MGINDTSSEPFTAGPVLRVYDDRSPYLALLSPAGVPTVRLLPPATRVDGDEADEELAVIVGVSELPPEEMNDIVGREERSRIDEARLRGSLRIRLLEHLEITMDPDRPASIWTLPESAW